MAEEVAAPAPAEAPQSAPEAQSNNTQSINNVPENTQSSEGEKSNEENNQSVQADIPKNAEEAFAMAIEKDLQNLQKGNSGSVHNEHEHDNRWNGEQEGIREAANNNSVSQDTDTAGTNDNADRDNATLYGRKQYEQLGINTTNEIVARAKQEAREYMNQNNYRKINLRDIQQYDEDTKTVTWVNPYNPNEPFTNLRDAKNFIADFNDSIDEEEKKVFNQSVLKWKERVSPYMEMERFNIRYMNMDNMTKKILLKNIMPHAKKHPETGQVIKFDCDLDKIADAVEYMIETYKNQLNIPNDNSSQDNIQEPVSQPPVDMKSSNLNTSNIKEEERPKNVSEAFSMAMKKELQKNNRKG